MRVRADIELALAADICLNSARKALRQGPEALRGRPGERAAEAMKRLGLVASVAPSSAPPPSGQAA